MTGRRGRGGGTISYYDRVNITWSMLNAPRKRSNLSTFLNEDFKYLHKMRNISFHRSDILQGRISILYLTSPLTCGTLDGSLNAFHDVHDRADGFRLALLQPHAGHFQPHLQTQVTQYRCHLPHTLHICGIK